MAAHRLPVLRDPLERPVTVGDCRGGYRPCPYVSCRHNLLLDVLEDGSLVINAPSKRLAGAGRTIPDEHEQERFWFVEVRIPVRFAPVRPESGPAIFALGPLGSSAAAKTVADAWQADNGPRTAKVWRRLPDEYSTVGPRREGTIDAKFADEVDDAIERWFDEPDPNTPSCLLDELAKVDRERALDDDGYLLEQIASVMYVSRERVRQVEAVAMQKFSRGLAAAGLTVDQLRDKD